jgi:hypothetical protein
MVLSKADGMDRKMDVFIAIRPQYLQNIIEIDSRRRKRDHKGDEGKKRIEG